MKWGDRIAEIQEDCLRLANVEAGDSVANKRPHLAKKGRHLMNLLLQMKVKIRLFCPWSPSWLLPSFVSQTFRICICRSNQSVHKRLKIIQLNFQDMELTSVHFCSGQLFLRSNVVHVISVHRHWQEVHCFIASEDIYENYK